MAPSGPRVLIIALAPIGKRMRGSAIRAVELARAVRAGAGARVTLAGFAPSLPEAAGFPVLAFDLADPRALRQAIGEADVVVCQPPPPILAGWLRSSGTVVIHDLYDPEALEILEFFRQAHPLRRRLALALCVDRTLTAMRNAHHLMCASEVQRSLWLGALLGARLLGPAVYDRDPTLRQAIDCVPFGVPGEAPEHSGEPGLRQTLGLTDEAEVILWNGGIWGWLDPTTAIEAVARLRVSRPRATLVFMGAAIEGEAARATAEAAARANSLGLLDAGVHFHSGWVPYERRADWLLEADCALSTHTDHLETRFAFRTRLLDCLWAGVPIVCTRGDELAELVERRDLGATAAPGDAPAIAAGLARVLERGRRAYRAALASAAEGRRWSETARPLVRWVAGVGAGSPPPRLGRPTDGLAPAGLVRTAALRTLHTGAAAVGLRVWPGI